MLKTMNLDELTGLLAAYKSGELETAEAVERIKNLHFEDIGFARVDHFVSAGTDPRFTSPRFSYLNGCRLSAKYCL